MKSGAVRATSMERMRPLPGDSLIADAPHQLTHAVSIRRPPSAVWPWLAQMGAGCRGGWYSYDALDNGGHASADRIVPALQSLAIGMTFPALPGATDCFTLLAFEHDRYLVLGWLAPDQSPRMTWAFVLEESAPGLTRVLVRARIRGDYRFGLLPEWLSRRVGCVIHFVMQRQQLLEIADRAERADAWLDSLLPQFDIVERHHVALPASAERVLATARSLDLFASRGVRAIVRAREAFLGAGSGSLPSAPLLSLMQSLGWRILAEVPGREVVVGAVTRPWEPTVTFHPLSASDFREFAEPGYVKILWTLRADPVGRSSVFRTETRVRATDAGARTRFRKYWRKFSPGIIAIRWLMLGQLRRQLRAGGRQSVA